MIACSIGWVADLRPLDAQALSSGGVLNDFPGIRRAQERDLAPLTRIYNQSVPERSATADTQLRNPAERQVWFEQYDWASGCPLLVFEEAGVVVGYAGAAPFRPGKQGYDGCLEVSLYIDQAARGKGLGRRLGHALIHASRSLNNRVLMALVFADNSRSNGLFAHLGFNLCAHLPSAVLFPEPKSKPRDVGIWMISL